jgi:cytochrome c peroxidase
MPTTTRRAGTGWALLILPVLTTAILAVIFALDDDDDATRLAAVTATAPGYEAVLGKMPVPPGNPMTDRKIALGKLLFFDPRLSGDNQLSCASCHAPDRGFSDGVARNTGPKGELGRNAPTIWNAAYADEPFWDGRASSLEQQAGGPLRADVEMAASIPELLKELEAIPEYVAHFREVFGEEGITFSNIVKAIAAFERTIVTADSPWDRYQAGDRNALTREQRRGEELFMSSRTSCSTCHTPPLFTDNGFHNLGVPQEGPLREDPGRYEVTKDPRDRGAFKTPTIRNIEFSGPYMHTGGFPSLESVIDFYDAGGGPDPYGTKSRFIRPLNLTKAEKKALVAYMKSLSDTSLRIDRPKLPGMVATKPESRDGAVPHQDHGGDANADRPAATVMIENLQFHRRKVTIKAGESVRWLWKEAVDHNIASREPDLFRSAIKRNGSFTHTFAKPGTYEYVCQVHGAAMTGSVVVEPAA